jgi:hypothetical protein
MLEAETAETGLLSLLVELVGLKSVFDVVFLPKSFAFEETILSV